MHLGQLILGSLSFGFYKVSKFLIGNLYTVFMALNRKRSQSWQVLSQAVIDKPLSMPVLMTKAPRWNTHAIIGTLGPISVQQYFLIDTDICDRAAKSWLIVVYSFPGFRTVTSVRSTDQARERVELPTGQYVLGLRYYNALSDIAMPVIQLDNGSAITSVSVPRNINGFYRDLFRRQNILYYSWHYYISVMLRGNFPRGWVEREILPVGAPDTTFLYGYLAPNQDLGLDIEPSLLRQCQFFLTFYTTASLPIDWVEVIAPNYRQEGHDMPVWYLLRIRSFGPACPPLTSQKAAISDLLHIAIAYQTNHIEPALLN
ncbi:MAG: DUF6208 family protein [Cyanobacteria bacterium P01_H01_bin.15]